MNLKLFQTEEATFLQGILEFDLSKFDDPLKTEIWWRRYQDLLCSIRFEKNEGFSIRISCSDKAALRIALFVWVKENNRRSLENYFGLYLALDSVVPGSIVQPVCQEDCDKLLTSFPKYRTRIDASGFRKDAVSFLCDFKIFTLLDDILAKASAYRMPAEYQINLYPFLLQAELFKAAKKNLLHMADILGLPEKTLKQQRDLVNHLPEKKFLVEEFLGFNRVDHCDLFSGMLAYQFELNYGTLGFVTPGFEFYEGAYENSLKLARYCKTSSNMPWDEICGSVIDDAQEKKILTWRPYPNAYFASGTDQIGVSEFVTKNENEQLNTRLVDNSNSEEIVVEIPLPYRGDSDFIFISYSHHDEKEIIPIIRNIMKWGYLLWWDKGIPGGAEWDALIEKKIEGCQLVILFLSESSVKSRFLRREVKFADAIGKSVMCVDLNESELSHGLKMLLSQYQRISFSTPGFYDSLKNGLEYLIKEGHN